MSENSVLRPTKTDLRMFAVEMAIQACRSTEHSAVLPFAEELFQFLTKDQTHAPS